MGAGTELQEGKSFSRSSMEGRLLGDVSKKNFVTDYSQILIYVLIKFLDLNLMPNNFPQMRIIYYLPMKKINYILMTKIYQ